MTGSTQEPAFGIPYAPTDPKTGDRICPVCGERCPESHDSAGELTTNTYAEHYAAEHQKADARAKNTVPSDLDVGYGCPW